MSAEHDLQQLRDTLEGGLHHAIVYVRRQDHWRDALDALSRVGERIDAQQAEILRLESLVAKSAETADVRADAAMVSGPELVALASAWGWNEVAGDIGALLQHLQTDYPRASTVSVDRATKDPSDYSLDIDPSTLDHSSARGPVSGAGGNT